VFSMVFSKFAAEGKIGQEVTCASEVAGLGFWDQRAGV
jgi:hypothetical protein